MDYAEAVRWYRKAAGRGMAEAQYGLASCYGQGKGVPQDDREATRWLTLSAAQGYAPAKLTLASATTTP